MSETILVTPITFFFSPIRHIHSLSRDPSCLVSPLVALHENGANESPSSLTEASESDSLSSSNTFYRSHRLTTPVRVFPMPPEVMLFFERAGLV